MREFFDVPLAELTTLRLGGPARRLVEAVTADEVVATVLDCDRRGEPLLVVGGGSNLVVGDTGFDGTVLRVVTGGRVWQTGADGGAGTVVEVAAGEGWDGLVAEAVARGLPGIEALSGIPGSVGATPIQNVGAYGQEVSGVVDSVLALDRRARQTVRLPAADCRFAYRHSVFKDDPDRYVIVSVRFRFPAGPHDGLSAPVGYGELARRLGVAPGERAPIGEVREAVLALRRSKGMVLDPDDPDSVSAGSFFTNPLLTADGFEALVKRVLDRLGPDEVPPRYPAGDGMVKTSAAWLIERAGFARGHGDGRARISTKHTLALTNPGGATTAELVALARQVRDGVRVAFGVELVNEPVFVGVEL